MLLALNLFNPFFNAFLLAPDSQCFVSFCFFGSHEEIVVAAFTKDFFESFLIHLFNQP